MPKIKSSNIDTSANLTLSSVLTVSNNATFSGSVGIGTSSLNDKFTVAGNLARSVARAAATSSEVELEAQASDYWSGPSYTGTAIGQWGGTATGTTMGFPNASLGFLRFQNGSNGLVYTNGNAPLAFGTNSTERMRIDSAGNVGIGTSSPQARLHADDAASFTQLAVGGSATVAGINFRNTVYNNGYIYYDNGASMNFQTNGSEKMRLDFNGNLGIGTTAPNYRLEAVTNSTSYVGMRVQNQATAQYAGSGLAMCGPSGGAGAAIYYYNMNAGGTQGAVSLNQTDVNGSYVRTLFNYDYQNQFWNFFTNGSERMRIDSSGIITVGTTTATNLYNGGGVNPGIGFESTGSIVAQRNNGNILWLSKASGYTDGSFIAFYTAGTTRGGIYYNSGTGQMVYATTSDYRAKDILEPVQNTGTIIDALKVYTGKMHGAEMSYPMLVAHEAQEVVPFAVSGEKDAVNEDGTPKYQQMDHAILVPLLIAEVQSLRTRLAALETK